MKPRPRSPKRSKSSSSTTPSTGASQSFPNAVVDERKLIASFLTRSHKMTTLTPSYHAEAYSPGEPPIPSLACFLSCRPQSTADPRTARLPCRRRRQPLRPPPVPVPGQVPVAVPRDRHESRDAAGPQPEDGEGVEFGRGIECEEAVELVARAGSLRGAADQNEMRKKVHRH